MHIVIDNRIRRSSTGRYSDRLVEHLQDIDTKNQYTVLVQPDDNWQPRSKNFKRADAPYKQFSFNPVEQLGFSRLLYKLKADVVHFPMNQQPLLYFKSVVTSTLDTTTLRTIRSKGANLLIFKLKRLGYRFLFWYSNKKSTQIITISNYVKNELVKMYPFTKGKTTTTYNASEPALAKKPIKPKGMPNNFILYVGTAFPHKNLKTLIGAHKQLQENFPQLNLVLAGKKEHYYQKLEHYVNTGGYTNILLPGFVSDAELKWLYENASAYVFPSLSEGFGLPGLEAMTHGCPVVSSNATCLPEIYGDAAAYFDPEKSSNIAEKVTEVLSNKSLRDKLIKNGYKQIKKYSWKKMAEQTLAVYKKAVK